MKEKIRLIAWLMLAFAGGFFWYALTHPESAFPWGNAISYTIYGIYILVMIALFIISSEKKNC